MSAAQAAAYLCARSLPFVAGRLLLVGTAHVMELALPLERVLRTFDPGVVALELDRERWAALRVPVRPGAARRKERRSSSPLKTWAANTRLRPPT